MSALNFHKLEDRFRPVGWSCNWPERCWLDTLIAGNCIDCFYRKVNENCIAEFRNRPTIFFYRYFSIFAVVLGLFISGQQYFRQSPSEIITTLVEAGYSPSQARDIYVKRLDKELKEEAAPAINLQGIIQSVLNQSDTDTLNAGKKKWCNWRWVSDGIKSNGWRWRGCTCIW